MLYYPMSSKKEQQWHLSKIWWLRQWFCQWHCGEFDGADRFELPAVREIFRGKMLRIFQELVTLLIKPSIELSLWLIWLSPNVHVLVAATKVASYLTTLLAALYQELLTYTLFISMLVVSRFQEGYFTLKRFP